MLTQLTDEILGEYSDDDLIAYIQDHFGDFRRPRDEAIAHYVSVMRMEPGLREDIFRVFRSAPLLCNECGAPSCLHGYPDD